MTTAGSQTTESRVWARWVRFAGVIMLVNGIFSIVQGLAAIIGPDTYYAVVAGNLFLFNIAGWGWFNLAIGVLLVATAFGLFNESAWARTTALVLVVISSVIQLILVPVQPWWAIIVIAIDMTIIYALVARGEEIAKGD
ncbi:MAG: hypothetical protein ABWX65_00890 [Mycetocola sp.]